MMVDKRVFTESILQQCGSTNLFQRLLLRFVKAVTRE